MFATMSFCAASVLALARASPVPGQGDGSCPPAGFDTQGDLAGGFDINWYANGTWYVQQQMPISYLPKGFNYCVAATYTIHKPTLLGYTVQVHNHAENQAGEEPSGPKDICGKVVNATGGKLAVAPCFIPSELSGPYWVVAFSVEEGWALVSGGPPTLPGLHQGTCKTGTGVNGSGLWIFTRQQVRDEAVVGKVRGLAMQKGFDLSVLRDVTQSNCTHSRTN